MLREFSAPQAYCSCRSFALVDVTRSCAGFLSDFVLDSDKGIKRRRYRRRHGHLELLVVFTDIGCSHAEEHCHLIH